MASPYVLLLPGLGGPGEEHWQNWLASELARDGDQADLPWFTEPDAPDREVWLSELRMHLDAAPRGVERVVVAHSLACLLWLHHGAQADVDAEPALRVDRVLLVAPLGPSFDEPLVRDFRPVPLDPATAHRVARETRMVVGDGDPRCELHEAKALAGALRVELDVVPGGRHLDAEAGYGPWPAVLDWVRTGRVPLTAR
ncbi:RBBP9/YdeN family alpha/beta hydrolase [Umezawaea beigongshangensis]|uniref:RBBP9/YdeN family alpha/beta hydrolase n=1 Tax=Umezawaea beigongshangensis TaxID=2780383 RepID=UPI0018F1CA13|nr:alpha/beta hydrolase [Umezawaea beigongshangensis]